MERNLLHLEDVYKQYGDKVILDDIDLSVRKGELCTVVGPSGCGKSTLLRLILGQERATKGDILLDNSPIGYAAPDRGIVYQKYSLYPHLTVLQNVMIGLNLTHGFFERRKKRKHFEDDARDFIRRVNLAGHEEKYPHELSGGMQQRAAIAQALIMRPRVLLMDEPFGALDPQTRDDMQLFLLELWEKEGMTVFFVTHDLEEAVFLGSRVIVLSQYYSDDRNANGTNRHGAKIVGDYIGGAVYGTEAKNDQKFREMMDEIRVIGFDKAHLQHVNKFNLHHHDSFQTLDINV